MSIDLTLMTVEQVSQLKRACEEHLAPWHGFRREDRAKRTPEFMAATAWRMADSKASCCECGADYPMIDLHFHDNMLCPACRAKLPAV